MAQLFTLQFPKYHYEPQRLIHIKFPNATKLPFDLDIREGMVMVDRIVELTEEERMDPVKVKERKRWHKDGLQEGVRMIKITNEDLTGKDVRDRLTFQLIDNLIKRHTQHDNAVDITFREEVLVEYGVSVSLGLEHGITPSQEHSPNSNQIKSKHTQLLGDESSPLILGNQLSASSYSGNNKPSECRLNNPSSCWIPTAMDMELKNSWLCVDLKRPTTVTMIRLQGDPKSKARVESVWIDHSADGLHWDCHHADSGKIQCVYDRKLESNDIYGAQPSNSKMDKFAEIEIWPVITCQFVRIRPKEYQESVAVRMDLFGPQMPHQEGSHKPARVIRIKDLPPKGQKKAMAKIPRSKLEDQVIQVDCRSVIRNALDKSKLQHIGFLKSDKDNYLCLFSTADLAATEETIDELMDAGIGRELGVAGICPMKYRQPPASKMKKVSEDPDQKGSSKGLKFTESFYASIKSRQIVDQLVDQTRQSAEWTYDYLAMLIVADVIAGMGLLTNSSVVVVASMLVSPIMGPVTAVSFGVHLRKYKHIEKLTFLGLKNEFFSLLVCIAIGLVLGGMTSWSSKNGLEGSLSEDPWPTAEMTSRGEVVGLATGAIVAFASGVGVALSVCGDYMSSVIGVAISASLLPPAVNCGMFWAMSLYVLCWPDRVNEHTADELAWMGFVSIVLTLENIILVFAASMMMFKIKGVTLNKDRNYDENNKQLVYQCITSFKDQWNEVKRKPTANSMSKSTRAAPSMKNVFGISDDVPSTRSLTNTAWKSRRTLKDSLMRQNTRKRLSPKRGLSTFSFGTSMRRLDSDLASIMEDGDDIYTRNRSLSDGRRNTSNSMRTSTYPISSNVQRHNTHPRIDIDASGEETRPLFTPSNRNQSIVEVKE